MYKILFHSRQDTGAGRRRGNSGWSPATSKTGFRVGHCPIKPHGASPSLELFFFTVLWPSPMALEEGGGERWTVTWSTKEVPHDMYLAREMNSGRELSVGRSGEMGSQGKKKERLVFHLLLRSILHSDLLENLMAGGKCLHSITGAGRRKLPQIEGGWGGSWHLWVRMKSGVGKCSRSYAGLLHPTQTTS